MLEDLRRASLLRAAHHPLVVPPTVTAHPGHHCWKLVRSQITPLSSYVAKIYHSFPPLLSRLDPVLSTPPPFPFYSYLSFPLPTFLEEYTSTPKNSKPRCYLYRADGCVAEGVLSRERWGPDTRQPQGLLLPYLCMRGSAEVDRFSLATRGNKMSFMKALSDLTQLVASGSEVPEASLTKGIPTPQGEPEPMDQQAAAASEDHPDQVDQEAASASEVHPKGSESTAREPRRKTPRMSGAARRRYIFWTKHGQSKEVAMDRCLQPLAAFPEYEELIASGMAEPPHGCKRPRSEGGSPKDQPKKASRVVVPNFADITASTKVGIIDANRPITADMAAKVEDEIGRHVDMLSGGGPRILGFTVRGGILILTCLNSATRDWLANRIGDFKPWEGSSLKLVDERDLPKPVVVVAFVPNSKVDGKTLLHRLHVQNEEVGCDRWRVIHEKPEGNGQTYCFGLDSSMLPALQKKSCALFLGMRVVQFRVKGPKTEQQMDGGSGAAGSGAPSGESSDSPAVASTSTASMPAWPSLARPTAAVGVPQAPPPPPRPPLNPGRGGRVAPGAPVAHLTRGSSRGSRGGPRRRGTPRGSLRGRPAARGLARGGPAQLPPLVNEHSARKPARNPLNSYPNLPPPKP